MMTRWLYGAVMLVGLAGCGVGGGADSASPGQIDSQMNGKNISSPALLSTKSRAACGGDMRAALPTGIDSARGEYLADLTLLVNFGAGFDQIRGQANGCEARDAVPLASGVAITNGSVFCGTNSNPAYTFDADVDGTLSNGTATYVIDASIEGEFLT